MTRPWSSLAIAFCLSSIPAVTRAQDAAEESDSSGGALDPDDVPAADEFPAGVSSGNVWRSLIRQRVLSPEEMRRERANRFDPAEPQLPAIVQVYVGLHVPLDSSLDGELRARRYGDSPVGVLGDVTFLGTPLPWLHLGGRIGARGRGWASNYDPVAMAGGIDALAIAHARGFLGRIVDLGVVIGAGIGMGTIFIQGRGRSGVAPRLHGALAIGFRLERGLRLGARIGWDWFTTFDLDRYGADLDLGGFVAEIGLEVRR